MTFTELLEAQRELNSHLSRRPTREELELAIIDEVGELTKALKWGADTPIPYPGWAWWQREDKPRSSAEEVLGECVDIMHFLLTGYVLVEVNPDEDERWFNLLFTTLHKSPPPSASYHLRRFCESHRIIVVPSRRLSVEDSESYSSRLYEWLLLFHAFGFTREDFNTAWHKSVEKNLRRWG